MSQRSSPAVTPSGTRRSLQQHEAHIDSRVAALQARLHSNRTTPDPTPTSAPGLSPTPRSSRRGFGGQFADDEARSNVSTTPPSGDRSARSQSAFGTPQRQQSPYTQGYKLPATTDRRRSATTRPSNVSRARSPKREKGKKIGWFQWFRLGCPSRRNAAQMANSQNHAFERQRLYAEEGRSTYGGTGASPPARSPPASSGRASREHGQLGAVQGTPRRLSGRERAGPDSRF